MHPRMLLAATLLASLSLPALADSQAILTLSDFQTQLKDLNPGDGVTPHIGWDGIYGSIGSSANTQHGWTQDTGPWTTNWTPVWVGSGNTADWNSTLGTLNGSAYNGHATQQLTATANSLETMALSAHAEAGQNIFSFAGTSQGFTLSAGTQATFSVMLTGSISGTTPTSGWSALHGYNNGPIDSSTFNVIMYSGQVNTNAGSSGASDWMWNSGAYESTVDGQKLTLTVKNMGNADRSYQLYLNANVSAFETTSPVPEPQSYAMFGAGMLLMGALARRRRQG